MVGNDLKQRTEIVQGSNLAMGLLKISCGSEGFIRQADVSPGTLALVWAGCGDVGFGDDWSVVGGDHSDRVVYGLLRIHSEECGSGCGATGESTGNRFSSRGIKVVFGATGFCR